MYTRQEASLLKQQFWTAFGQYMAPIHSSEGLKINWVNYKTGMPHVHFKMDADNEYADIGIVFSDPDKSKRTSYFEQFAQLMHILHDALGEEWNWDDYLRDENDKINCKIYTRLPGVNIFRKDHWPLLISFFKPRIIALDSFWETARYVFDPLR